MAERDFWLARRRVIERTHGRTWHLLLTASLFYWALDRWLVAPNVGWPDLNLPFIDTGLSSAAVWATGPLVVSCLTLAVLGTLEALGHAGRAIGAADSAAHIETDQFAISPTAVDLAFYASADSPRLWGAVVAFAHPLVITALWVVSTGRLLTPMWSVLPVPDHYWVLRVLGGLTPGACIPRLVRLWASRSARAWHVFARLENGPAVVVAPGPGDTGSRDADRWRARRAAVDQIQARYLYVLLIASIFYWALDSQFYPIEVSLPPRVTFRFITIELSSLLVWATGSMVIAFLCLVQLGAREAIRHADCELSRANAASDRQIFDAEPTALEMAFYCAPDTHRFWRVPTALWQPVAITLPWFFAFRLLVSPLWWAYVDFDQYRAFQVAGAALVIACLPRLARLWVAASRKVRGPIVP